MMSILLIISGYAIYQAINRIAKSKKCPTDKVLRQFFRGQLYGTATADRIISHIGSCEQCQYKADEFIGKV